MGLSLTTDTSFQKILMMVGPRRTGKGTVARVMAKLVGEANVAGLMASSLAGSFGLQPLLGKSIATMPDARFHGDGIVTVVERLLAISGEDTVTVDRKHRESVTTKLNVRFVILSNELPKLTDASNALTGRFIILKFTESFYGREDRTLQKKLNAELPGIFLWAVEGLKRLLDRGHFIQPEVSEELIREMEDLASPVGKFVRERCEVGREIRHRVVVDRLYKKYAEWCADVEGQKVPPTKSLFSSQLKAVVPYLATKQGTGGERFFHGVCLSQEFAV